jgi:hypothetical protein
MYSGRSWWEGGEPKARYIQENAKTLNGGPVYPTTIEPIITQGFMARIVALFYIVMQYKGYLITSSRDFFKQIDYVTDAISSLILD